MRLAFFTHYFPPETNAPAARMHELARALVSFGHELHVVTAQPNHPRGVVYPGYRAHAYTYERIDGIHVHRCPTIATPNRGIVRRSLMFGAVPLAQVAMALRHVPTVDVVLATTPQLLTAVAGIAFSRVRQCAFVLDVRDLWPDSIVAVGAMPSDHLAIRGLRRLERTVYRAADRVVIVAESFAAHVAAAGVDPQRITWIPNGIDVDAFAPDTTPANLRTQLGLGDALIVMFCGVIGMAHDLDLLVRAAPRRPPELDVHFVLVGDGAERDHLARSIAAARVDDRIHLLSPVARNQVPALLAAADVSLVSLRNSPAFAGVLPSKMFEAMGMAKPIALGVGGEARRLLERAAAGVAFTPGDVDDFWRAIARLSEVGPQVRANMGQSGRSYVLEHHRRNDLARRLEVVLERAAAR